MDKERIVEAINRNKKHIATTCLAGVKLPDGTIFVVKCVDKPELTDTIVTKSDWKNIEVSKPNNGIPITALYSLMPTKEEMCESET